MPVIRPQIRAFFRHGQIRVLGPVEMGNYCDRLQVCRVILAACGAGTILADWLFRRFVCLRMFPRC